MSGNSGKPMFAITPASSVSSMCNDNPAVRPSEVEIGMPNSDSTARLMPTPTGETASQDSRESLLARGRKETWFSILVQVVVPFLIAGLGMVLAGVILDIVKDWAVFKDIPEFLVLVTPLLGLKGNLEMTLASRLSTQANLGNLDVDKKWRICVANLTLIQVQAVVVGFLSSVVAIVIGVILPGEKAFNFHNALILCSSSVITAAIASLILGFLMVLVIFLSRRMNINPDNVATPIAGTVGDVTTLGILACTASFLHSENAPDWSSYVIIAVYLLTTPIWAYCTYKSDYTKEVLTTGWTPVICAMLISSMGGLILDKAEQKFAPLALYQPVINGVGGNLVSVQASRISTSLHRDCGKCQLPPGTTSVWASPWEVFTKKGVDSVAARVLLGLVIPGHLLFASVTHFISIDSQFSVAFLSFYLGAALIQVALLLYCAQILIRWLWLRNIDPDSSAICYLTALGDLLGTGLLFLAFESVNWIQPI